MSRLNLTDDVEYHKGVVLVVALLIAMTGCESETDQSGDVDDFATGEFAMQTHTVDDQCLDGGLNLLFMPEGEAQAWEWPYPVTLHAQSELEKTYTMQLREPFGEMEVTASQNAPNRQQLEIHPNPEVKLGEERFGDCVVELEGTAGVTLVDSDNVEGAVYVTLSNPRGDERCPAEMPDECEVDIGFTGTRTDGN